MFGVLRMSPLPVLFVGLYTITCATTYIWAVLREDVDPLFPYLSSTGDKRPQSCFFSMGTNLCSMLVFIIIYLRYRHLSAQFGIDNSIHVKVHKYSRFVGYTAAIGMFFVANVQDTAIIKLHITSAVITFGSGSIYMLMQAFVTYHMYPENVTFLLLASRITVGIISTTAFVLAFIFGTLAANKYHSYYPDLPTPHPWSRKMWQPGFEYHIISGCCEWIVVTCHLLYIISFAPEFEDLVVEINVLTEEQEQERQALTTTVNHEDA